MIFRSASEIKPARVEMEMDSWPPTFATTARALAAAASLALGSFALSAGIRRAGGDTVIT